jgi:hypothetical protein
MPKLPITLPCRLDSGALPVSDTDDVLAAWSGDIAGLSTAKLRDAIVAGQLAALKAYQQASGYAAAQSDPLRATGEYLDEIGAFERDIKRGAGEADATYRARVNAQPTLVSPEDVLAAANAALAPYTDVQCRYAERCDGIFPGSPDVETVYGGTSYQRSTAFTTFSSHAYGDYRSAALVTGSGRNIDDGGANSTPNYPDRRYGLITSRRPAGTTALGVGLGPSSWPVEVVPTIGLTPLSGTVSGLLGPRLPILLGSGTSFLQLQRGPQQGVDGTNGTLLAISDGVGFVIIYVTQVLTDTQLKFALWNPDDPFGIGFAVWTGELPITFVGAPIYPVTLSTQAISDEYGRYFHLRVPDISAIDSTVNAAYQLGDPLPPETPAGGGGCFPGIPADGVSAQNGVFPFGITKTSDGVYEALIDSVEAVRGQSTRWSMLSDPTLAQ